MEELLKDMLAELKAIHKLLEPGSHSINQPNPHLVLSNIADMLRKENPKAAGIFDAMTKGLGGNNGK